MLRPVLVFVCGVLGLGACKFPPPPDVDDDGRQGTDAANADAAAVADASGTCGSDEDCASGFCADGLCAAEADVIYVKRGEADNPVCGRTSMCGTPAHAVTLVGASRRYLLIAPSGLPYYANPDGPILVSGTVVIHALGAAMERNGSGEIVSIQPDAVVTMVGGTIRGALGGSTADGIRCAYGKVALRSVSVTDCADRGLDAGACEIAVDRAVFARNAAGAIRSVDGRFAIQNSFFFDNGGGTSGSGAMILNPNMSPNELAFNTIYRNATVTPNGAGGVSCLGTTITARNNLIYGNTGASEAVGASCSHSYSVIGPGASPGGPMVRSMTLEQVAFINPNGTTEADFHIKAVSELRGAADPTTPLTVDFDGDARPNPAGTPPDIGADEVP